MIKTFKDFKIGYAPTRRAVFSREDALKYKTIIKDKIKSLGYETIDIEGINKDGLLLDEKDIETAVKKLKDAKVDCVFSPHCNFGTEDVVARLAKEMGLPFLLWGPRDEAPQLDGSRLRDSQCGLFATSKILARLDVPFTYIINSRVDDDIFIRGFENFTKAANIVKIFKKIRIGQIGTRARPFLSVIANEGELLEKFGIQIIPYNLIDVVLLAKEIKEENDGNYKNTLSYIKENFEVLIDEDKLENIVSLKEAIKRLKASDNISAFSIQCWTTLNEIYGIVPCLANSLLFDEGIPVACEGDICGSLSALIAQSASFGESKVIFADITNRHPVNNNGELLWHCGPFPTSLKKKGLKGKILCHGILNNSPAGICSFEIEGGDITIVRFDGLNGNYKLLAGHAQGIEGPKTVGTYLWIEVKDWTRWEEKLIYGPYIHHVVAVHGRISPILYEATRYIKGLTLDAIEPDENEIRDYLTGRLDSL